jgi:signal transduction histidine kinase
VEPIAASVPNEATVRIRGVVVLALAAVAAVAAAVAALLFVPAAGVVGFGGTYATDLTIGIGFTTIGVLVARRRPDNRIGWLFLAIGVVESIVAASTHYAIVGIGRGAALPGATWAGWLGYWLSSLVVPSGLFLLLLLLFPDGRFLSPRWRWLGWAGVVFSLTFALTEILLLERVEVAVGIEFDNPTNVIASALPKNIWIVGVVILLAGVMSVALRYRRSTGEQRQQLRWFLFAVATGIGALATLTIVYFAIGAPEREPLWLLFAFQAVPLVTIGVGVPAACGVAVLRYRLWELDVVIRKAVVVAVVTGVITIVYVAIVGGFGAIVGSRLDTALGFVAAAVVAIAFQPIRGAAGRFADRVVYGKRATPYEVLSDFSERVGEAYAADDVLPRMAEVLGRGTGATGATVWLLVSGELRPAASWPEHRRLDRVLVDDDAVPPLGEPAFEVRHGRELLGALSVSMPPDDPIDATKERLARDLAAQAGLVLRNVRLIEELRASRQRLVSAQDDERRKLERNLHDGAQQQLVALQVQLRLIEAQVPKDPDKAVELLRGVGAAAGTALDDLRDLARGIYPPLLADRGLAAALRAQADRSPVAVTVLDDGIERYPREVEAAVYFCTLEALNNVAKYAEANAVEVRLVEDDGALWFTIIDDGRGFDQAQARTGTGVQGMIDRLDAIGGTLQLSSEPGRGTTVRGTVPVRT